jgi:hypothetical protein
MRVCHENFLMLGMCVKAEMLRAETVMSACNFGAVLPSIDLCWIDRCDSDRTREGRYIPRTCASAVRSRTGFPSSPSKSSSSSCTYSPTGSCAFDTGLPSCAKKSSSSSSPPYPPIPLPSISPIPASTEGVARARASRSNGSSGGTELPTLCTGGVSSLLEVAYPARALCTVFWVILDDPGSAVGKEGEVEEVDAKSVSQNDPFPLAGLAWCGCGARIVGWGVDVRADMDAESDAGAETADDLVV